jgi:hypothetical protein
MIAAAIKRVVNFIVVSSVIVNCGRSSSGPDPHRPVNQAKTAILHDLAYTRSTSSAMP